MKTLFRSLLLPVVVAANAHAAGNLIFNGDFEAGNTGFTSNYTFKPGYRPPDLDAGQYQITTDANLSHFAWTNPGPQGDGTYFFVANASDDTSLSPWMQTVSISPGDIVISDSQNPVYYRFQAYISSLYPANPPELSFEMSLNNSGNWQTLTTSVAPSSTGVWELTYRDGWFGSEPTSISFRLRNALGEAGGNDLGIDSIYFGLSDQAPDYGTNPIASIGEITGVPEPSALGLLLPTLATVAWLRRWKNCLRT
jgi:hypothetical protein